MDDAFEDLPGTVSLLVSKVNRLADIIEKKSSMLAENADQIVNSQELSKLLDVSIAAIRKLRNEGKIPFIQIGNNYRYNLRSVIRSLEQQYSLNQDAAL